MLLYVHGVCVCTCMYVPVHVKARGQLRWLLDCAPPYETGFPIEPEAYQFS